METCDSGPNPARPRALSFLRSSPWLPKVAPPAPYPRGTVTACAFILVYILNSLILINIFTHIAKPSIITYFNKPKVNLPTPTINRANSNLAQAPSLNPSYQEMSKARDQMEWAVDADTVRLRHQHTLNKRTKPITINQSGIGKISRYVYDPRRNSTLRKN